MEKDKNSIYLELGCNKCNSFYNYIKSIPMPLKEEYMTIDEYNKAFNEYLLFILDAIVKNKKELYISTLEQYNNKLGEEREVKEHYNFIQDKIKELKLDEPNKIKFILWPSLIVLALISLPLAVFLVVITILLDIKSSINAAKIKKIKESSDFFISELCKQMDDFYNLVNILRDDYNKNQKTLEAYLELIKNNPTAHIGDTEFVNMIIGTVNPINVGFDKETCDKAAATAARLEEALKQIFDTVFKDADDEKKLELKSKIML